MSNNNIQPDKNGSYYDKVSQKNDNDGYVSEGRKLNENLRLGSGLLSGGGAGLIPSVIILLIFVGVFAFILPKMELFNHVVVPENYVSGADIPNYIKQGATGEEVISLQKALFKLGAFSIDDVTGVYDKKSSDAVNKILRDNSMDTGDNCSLRAYRFIVALSNGEAVVSAGDSGGEKNDSTAEENNGDPADKNDKKTDKDKEKEKSETEKTEKTTKETEKTKTTTTTTGSTTTTKTTASTTRSSDDGDEEEDGRKIRITEDAVRLYAKMRKSSTILFYVEEGDEYKLLETETDDNGNVWYKIEYKDICTGWIQGDKAEVIS